MASNHGGVGNELFSSFQRQYLYNGTESPKLLLMTNRKSYMHFRLAPRLKTLTAIRSNFLGISRDFADIRSNNC